MKLFEHVSIATEVIDHQLNDKKFKDELIEQFQQIKNKLDSGVYISNNDIISNGLEIGKIKNLILKRIGINLEFKKLNFEESRKWTNNASILAIKYNYMNPLLTFNVKEIVHKYSINTELNEIDQYIKEDFDMMQRLKDVKSTVDLKNAKITGKINEHPHITIVDFKGFFKNVKVTPGELAAILMHEVGHAFTYLENTNKIVTINQALYNIANKKKTMDKAKVFKIAFADLSKIDGTVTDKDIEQMLSDNSIIASFALYKFIAKNTNLESLLADPVDKNSYYNSENMADVFATRFGFGQELANGLSKAYNKDGEGRYHTEDTFLLLSLTTILSILAMSVILFISGMVIVTGAAVLTIISVFTAILDERNKYKKADIRFQKIYNELVDSLKYIEMSNVEKKNIIMQLRQIKLNIDIVFVAPTPITEKLVLAVAKNSRTNMSYDYQQDILEKLASNELFVKSVELELLHKGA
jgi:hypothetical protein